MKATFFAIFDPTWTLILAAKHPSKEFLNSILVKKDKNYIIINFVALRLTKVKFMKIIIFLPFLTQIDKNVAVTSFKCGISSFICLKFPLTCLYNHSFVFKKYCPCKIWKKPIDNTSFFYFFHNTGLNLGKILPQDHTHFVFFAGFQWNKLGDSININNFNCNPEVMKVRGFN